MKLAKMTWVLGGMVAVGLGMGAQACSSSNSPGGTGGGTDAGSTSNNTSAGGSGCATLTACCASLTGATATSCTAGLTAAAGNAAMCTTFLGEVTSKGDCVGISSSTGSTGTTGTSSGGQTTGPMNTGTTATTGPTGESSESSQGSSGSSCEAPKEFPEATAGVYCPFTANDGGHAYCEPGQFCNEPYANDAGVYPPSACAATAAMNATVIECLEAIDCATSAAGKVCCGTGMPTSMTCSGTTYNKVSKFGGTKCAASCTATGFTICESPTDCTSPQTCVPSEAYGNDFGICTSP